MSFIQTSVQNALLNGKLPDSLVRAAVRGVLDQQVHQESRLSEAEKKARVLQFVQDLKSGPISPRAKEEATPPYELPTDFFRLVYGKRMKSSACLWNAGVTDLDQAESDMLAVSAERAGIRDGQKILDLGAGWGSLSLYLAEQFPNALITAVVDTHMHLEHLKFMVAQKALANVDVVFADFNDYEPALIYDRVVSIETLERLCNYKDLFHRVRSWLGDDGRMFAQIYAHRGLPYRSDEARENERIARHFFSGGLMPSEDLFSYFQDDLLVERQWRYGGTHARNTCEAWLIRLDAQRPALWPIFERTYGKANASRMWNTWRVYFMAQAELFGFAAGASWATLHLLWMKK